MTRIRVFKVNKGLAYFLISLGGIQVIVSLGLFIKDLMTDFDSSPEPWNYALLFAQGVLLIILAGFNIRSGKYYIEWDNYCIKYLLPKSKAPESILLADIKDVKIKLFEIHIQGDGIDKILDLENVQFDEIRAIKNKFEQIKEEADGR